MQSGCRWTCTKNPTIMNKKTKAHRHFVNASILSATAVLLLSGCASMSTMQTARTTEKGEFGYDVGGGYIKTDIALGTADTISFKAPFLEIGGRYGVTDKLDLGAKLTLIGTATADAKYQFLGDGESMLAGSAGFGLGYLSISSGSGVNTSDSKIFDIMVPAYFSVHPTDWFSVYASPRYVFRINSYSSSNESGTDNSSWYGVTAGIRLGKRVGFLAEYSYFGNSEIPVPLSQFTGGIAVGIR